MRPGARPPANERSHWAPRADAVFAQFLELGIATRDVAGALAFYESLGFVQAPVGEAWPHPYAVVTDGRLNLGLHGLDFEGPLLTFVTPGVRSQIDRLQQLGIEIEHARIDDLSLNEVAFRDPALHAVRLLEARTFSPPSLPPGHESVLGYFQEYRVATADPAAAGRFWEGFGFVAFDGEDATTGRIVASSRDLNLAFEDLSLDTPVPCFVASDMGERIARLRERGFEFARRVPRALASQEAALLQAPDGMLLLLARSEA
jgi:catechol 2,3-dioxygenase-like lactoylglutathione lyase family enzyme